MNNIIIFQWKEALRAFFDPKWLKLLCYLCLAYNFYHRPCSFPLYLSKYCGWSTKSTNLRAIPERILWESSSWPTRSRPVSFHRSSSYKNWPKFIVNTFGFSWSNNFYIPLNGPLAYFLAFYFYLKNSWNCKI